MHLSLPLIQLNKLCIDYKTGLLFEKKRFTDVMLALTHVSSSDLEQTVSRTITLLYALVAEHHSVSSPTNDFGWADESCSKWWF